MQEGKVYRLRDGAEAKEFTDSLGWLWVFLGPSHPLERLSYAKARSVATGDITTFFSDAFEEVSDARG